MAMAGEPLQVCLHGGSTVDRFHVRNAASSEPSQPPDCKQCYLNNNTVDYVFRVNSLRNNNVTFDRNTGSQTIRIRVSSIDEEDFDEQKPRSEEQLSRAVQGLTLEQRQSAPRSRSPSPLLEVPLEAVDTSREIRRPPL